MMTESHPADLEESGSEAYTRFIQLLKAIATVPKTAIYELDPQVKPKSKPLS